MLTIFKSAADSFDSEEMAVNQESKGIKLQAAIDQALVKKLSFNVEETHRDQISDGIKKTNLLLLAETHGVSQNPPVVYTLAKQFGIKNIALEWSPQYQPLVDEFLRTGEINMSLWPTYTRDGQVHLFQEHDGRMTAEYFAMLKQMKEEGILDKVILYCSTRAVSLGSDLQLKENDMANTLEDHLLKDNSPTLVVGGIYHTGTKELTIQRGSNLFGEGETITPMGAMLKRWKPDTPSISIECESGEFYNFEVIKFSDNISSNAEPRITAVQPGDSLSKWVEINNAFAFSIPLATVAFVPK